MHSKYSGKLIRWIHGRSLKDIVLLWLTGFAVINLSFAAVYYVTGSIERADDGAQASFVNCIYYSVISFFTLGYGDFLSVGYGKLIVIGQCVVSSLYTTAMMAIFTTKLLSPRESLHFSDHILYNRANDVFIFRLTNADDIPILNPTLKINVICHAPRYEDAPNVLVTGAREMAVIDRKIMANGFKNEVFSRSGETSIHREYEKACAAQESAFCIEVVLSGYSGSQVVTFDRVYTKEDIEEGEAFAPVTAHPYSAQFWKEFHRIV